MIHALLMALLIFLIQSISYIILNSTWYYVMEHSNIPLLNPPNSLINLLMSKHHNVIVERTYSVRLYLPYFYDNLNAILHLP